MTRSEVSKLKAVSELLGMETEAVCVVARRAIGKMIAAAEIEHAAEDRHHDALENKPINLHQQAAE